MGANGPSATPAIRAKNAGYAYCQIGENLASASDSRGFSADGYAKLAVEGWEHSPGHRKNMLLAPVTETGVAIAKSGRRWMAGAHGHGTIMERRRQQTWR